VRRKLVLKHKQRAEFGPLLPEPECKLLALAVYHVASQRWIVAAELQAVYVVLAVLLGCIRVCAFGAAQLDHDTIALLTCHGAKLLKT
jgi:hypothetical protein